MVCSVDADRGLSQVTSRSFATTASEEVRAAGSSCCDTISKRIDHLAADVEELQREVARIKAERECTCPACTGPTRRQLISVSALWYSAACAGVNDLDTHSNTGPEV